jgi:hypothetical protein
VIGRVQECEGLSMGAGIVDRRARHPGGGDQQEQGKTRMGLNMDALLRRC